MGELCVKEDTLNNHKKGPLLSDWFIDGHKGDLMNKFKRAVMWVALALIILLILLSVFGAFVGSDRAKNFFNSLPLAVYWLAFMLLLIVAIAVFRRMVRVQQVK